MKTNPRLQVTPTHETHPANCSALRIYVRRVVAANGDVASENEVFCLRQQTAVAVATCEGCRANGGAEINLQGHRNYVLCESLDANSARGLPPTQHPLRPKPMVTPSVAGRTAIAQIMTSDVWCVEHDVDVATIGRLLVDRQIGAAPIVDGARRCIGMVSERDFLSSPSGNRTAAAIGSRLVFCLSERASIAECAALMALEGAHHVAVINDDERLTGIVSSSDILGFIGRQDGYGVE